ncbi:MAG: beta-galactosidase [Phycisphaerales bacterium]
MARMTHDPQSFLLENRRLWFVGAGIDYARVPHELWAHRIEAVRNAGFNTIVTVAPWLLHEQRKGRFSFSKQTDIQHFVTLCRDAGLFVGLRVGPYVGSGYDGGGLPSWLREIPDIMLREPNAPYLERVVLYLRKLLNQVVDLQIKQSGDAGLAFVQVEQSWFCSNDEAANGYLSEVARHVRENGIVVPILGANDLWAEGEETVETWSGWDNLLANLRQLRIINPNHPRIASSLEMAMPVVWGDPIDDADRQPDDVLNRVGQVLAAGAQPILSTFHAGTNFGFLAGRQAGRPDGFIATNAGPHAPLAEGGIRTAAYDRVKRLVTFATSFSHVFADLDPDYQPVTVALEHLGTVAGSRQEKPGGHGVAVVPLRGSQGRIIFVFGDPYAQNQSTKLLLDHGLALSIELGDQSVAWTLIDADLGGRAWLDYCNLCPFALIDRTVLVFFGPEKAAVNISINESVIQDVVPGGQKPRIIEHNDLTVVICSQGQIDAALIRNDSLYVGVDGFDAEGQPLMREGFSQVVVIRKGGVETIKPEPAPRAPASTRLSGWTAATAQTLADGSNPRYATLAGPETLDNCGAPTGYGWYRVQLSATSARKRLCALPQCGQRLALYVDGKLDRIIGAGPGGSSCIFDLKLPKGDHTIVGLADHAGRFSGGNDIGRRKGWFGHIYEIKAFKTTKPKVIDADPVDPFLVRAFLLGQSKGRMSSPRQAVWNFTHRKKAPVLLEVRGMASPGLFLLNDEPLYWFAGDAGETAMQLLIEPFEKDSFKRGANELRFAPDPDYIDAAEAMAERLAIYECVDAITESGQWGFARWEPPAASQFEEPLKSSIRKLRGRPCWWRTTFVPKAVDRPMWLDVSGLSKGVAFVNGHNLGRYFTQTQTGENVGPQTKLYVPEPWVKGGGEENEVMIFDEHGYDPGTTRIEYA